MRFNEKFLAQFVCVCVITWINYINYSVISICLCHCCFKYGTKWMKSFLKAPTHTRAHCGLRMLSLSVTTYIYMYPQRKKFGREFYLKPTADSERCFIYGRPSFIHSHSLLSPKIHCFVKQYILCSYSECHIHASKMKIYMADYF